MSSTRSKPEYINKLPENVFEIKNYVSLGEYVYFDRYWLDMNKCQVIMKPKRMNKYKIVHPMIDKYHDSRFIHMIDINGKIIFVNYDYLIDCYSIGYYLSIK